MTKYSIKVILITYWLSVVRVKWYKKCFNYGFHPKGILPIIHECNTRIPSVVIQIKKKKNYLK